MLAGQIDLGAAMMGSWLDSMKASSPRYKLVAPRVAAAGDAEQDDWMVRVRDISIFLVLRPRHVWLL
jgi:trehalose 6-phosphate phosphatase